MGVNYRNAPIHYRGKDPSEWFSNRAAWPDELPDPGGPDGGDRRFGDPETMLIQTYPSERLRIRLIQGSHEEQHGFVLNGMRWRREWHIPNSTLVNQQTLGISEAFTLDIDPADAGAYGLGDHLWSFQAIDDLWLGCWGYVRVVPPTAARTAHVPQLPCVRHPVPQAPLVPRHLPTGRRIPVGDYRAGAVGPDDRPYREYFIAARRREHEFHGTDLTDPWGLQYVVATGVASAEYRTRTDRRGRAPIAFGRADPARDLVPPPQCGEDLRLLDGHLRATGLVESQGPLVLRARAGEWIKVVLVNEVLLPDPEHDHLDPRVRAAYLEHARVSGFAPWRNPHLPRFGPEVSPPRVPVERLDQFRRPTDRTVSPRVSLHASLLSYDVVADDGSAVGSNHDGTVGPLDVAETRDAHGGHGGGSAVVGRPAHTGHVSQNWRTYWWYADPALIGTGEGQVCYLYDLADIRNHRHHGLIGAIVVLPEDHTPVNADGHEAWAGPAASIRRPGPGVRPEERVLFLQDGLRLFAHGDPDAPLPDIVSEVDPVDAGQRSISYRTEPVHVRTQLTTPKPATPVLDVPVSEDEARQLWLRLVTAADKPRNHTFTVHGHAWRGAPRPGPGPGVGAVGGLTAGSVHDLVLDLAGEPGDYAYRSGVFRWAVQQGMWGILRLLARTDERSSAARPAAPRAQEPPP